MFMGTGMIICDLNKGAEPMDREMNEKRGINDEIRERSEKLARTGKGTVVHELDRVSSALHTAAENLHHENDMFARAADFAADRIGSAAGYLDKREPGELIGDLNGIARKNIFLTMGGFFAAGFLVTRFLKAGIGNGRHGGDYESRT